MPFTFQPLGQYHKFRIRTLQQKDVNILEFSVKAFWYSYLEARVDKMRYININFLKHFEKFSKLDFKQSEQNH